MSTTRSASPAETAVVPWIPTSPATLRTWRLPARTATTRATASPASGAACLAATRSSSSTPPPSWPRRRMHAVQGKSFHLYVDAEIIENCKLKAKAKFQFVTIQVQVRVQSPIPKSISTFNLEVPDVKWSSNFYSRL